MVIKNIIKSLASLVLLLLICGIHTAAAGQNQVYDLAELMSGEEISELTRQTNKLSDKYQMNFVILTTADAEAKTAEDYADDFYMDQGFYDNNKKGGVIYLIDMDNRELRVEAAGDMIYYLTDERKEQILDAGYDYLTDERYSDCFAGLLNQTQNFIEAGIPSNQYTYDTETGRVVRYRSIRPIEAAIAVIAALLAGGIACAAIIGKYRLKWGTYKYPFREKSNVTLTTKEDRFINQVVTSRHIPRNPPPSSGGGFGGGSGGSSTRTSGGGGTFSGSGRKF